MKKSLYFLALLPSLLVAEDSTQPIPSNGLDFTVDASFTYWYAKEDGLNVARSAVITGAGLVVDSSDAQMLKQSFSYEPGFIVGVGMGTSSEWDLHAAYIYYRSTNTTSQSAPSNPLAVAGTGVWLVNDWFLQSTPISDQQVSATHISSKWHLGMDLGDLTFRRPMPKGKGFKYSPFAGLRTVWIRQSMDVDVTQAAASVGLSRNYPAQPIHSNTTSHSWGIGPRLGAEGVYSLPVGFFLKSHFAASLLYTKFTSLDHNEQRVSLSVADSTFSAHMSDYNTVRAVLDANLGFGWGIDFCDNYRFDLIASYDFSYFWGQNMMRNMLDEFSYGSASGDNDLYFQGLAITAGFHF